MDIRELSNYPEELQGVVKILFEHEGKLTYGYSLFDGANGEEELEKAAIEIMTTLAQKILTEVKKQLENQYPLWRYENGQFVKVDS